MWEKIKTFIPKLIIAIIAVAVFLLVGMNAEAYSSYGNAVLLVAIAGFLFYAFDKWVLHGFNTFEEIQKGNISAAVLVLAYAIVVGCSIIAAFK